MRMLTLLLCLLSACAGDDDSANNNVNVNGNDGPICGNGVLEIGELCDDGANNSDSIPNACRTDCREAFCGDSIIDSGEQCDRESLASNSCVGLGYTKGTLACRSECTYDIDDCTTCGNGTAEGTDTASIGHETCDGSDLRGQTCITIGQASGTLQCNSTCGWNISGCTGGGPVCGNGVVEGNESCDDTNNTACDGCSPACQLELCGNGIPECLEECDQGVETQTCDSDCTYSACGDGVLNASAGEQCDDGSANSDSVIDACRLDCSTAYCGDEIIDTGEECDDGNQNAADGCDLGCVVENGWVCTSVPSVCYNCGNGMCEVANGEYFGNCQADCGATAVAADTGHSCGVLGDGTVWCWGLNTHGQLGDGQTHQDCNGSDCSPTPVQVIGLTGVESIVAGMHFNCVLFNGTVWCWGNNDNGQLGTGNTTNQSTPAQLSGITDAIEVAAGERHACIIRSDTSVWCWGRNPFGELGNGTTTTSYIPLQVPGFFGASAINAGSNHTCVAKNDATVWCWGYNSDGQLGDGSTTHRYSPVQVFGVTNGAQVACGHTHTCLLRSDNTVSCWGDNQYGQLGNNSTTDSSVPEQVIGLSNASVLAVGTGSEHAVVQALDGSVVCWGYNQYGQLGDGTMTDSSTQVGVLGLTNSQHVSGGYNHSCSVESNGTVWCWGWNTWGQLGDTTTTDSTTPVQVSF